MKDYKKFDEISDEFLDFIADSRLVIHNAPFDVGFLNFELQRCGKKLIDSRNVVDTLALAKEKFPGSPATLDALCRRFSVDASSRTKHGALIDADLLAKVYLHMSVEKLQKNLFGDASNDVASVSEATDVQVTMLEPRVFSPSDDEINAHFDFLKKLKNPIWSKYINNEYEES